MKPIIFNADYLLDPNLMKFDKPVEIHVSRFSKTEYSLQKLFKIYNIYDPYYKIKFQNKNAYKVLLLSNEPECSINKESIKDIIAYHKEYDLILCTDSEILKNCDNSVLFPYGGTWLNKVEMQHSDSLGVYEEGIENSFLNKKFKASFLTTSHLGMIGYDMRKIIWNNRDKIKIPTVFWSSCRFPTNNRTFSNTLHDGLIPNDLKDNLFYSQFCIVTENCIQSNYFSEKIIDCLLTKTIPIYFGCPNISDYFDTRGILIFNDFDEFLNIINNLTESTYENMKEYVELNFNMAKEYGKSFTKRVENVIQNNINPKNIKNDILFSIGILTVPQRKHYLNRILNKINSIIPKEHKNSIEIIVNNDNMVKTVGQKRNEVLHTVKGKYVAFIDDDDMISDDYFELIIPELEKDVDAVGWYGMYYVNNFPTMQFSHANKNNGHFKQNGVQYRPVNHLNPVKTHIAKQIGFPEKNFAEDADYCNRLLDSGLIKSESNIDKILYHYLWNPKETLTQK